MKKDTLTKYLCVYEGENGQPYREGYTVVYAQNKYECARMFREKHPDILDTEGETVIACSHIWTIDEAYDHNLDVNKEGMYHDLLVCIDGKIYQEFIDDWEG